MKKIYWYLIHRIISVYNNFTDSFFSTEDGSGRQLNASEKRQALKQKRNYQMLTKGRQKALEKQDVEIDDDTGTLEIEATKQQNYQHMPVIGMYSLSQ